MRTLQAFTNERLATGRCDLEVERAYGAARSSTRARSFLTAIVIFLVFASIVAMLWVGSQDALTGQITGGRLGQFLLYAALAAGAPSELSQVWGDVSAASGAAERLFEILRLKPANAAPASPPGRCRCLHAATSTCGRHFVCREGRRESRHCRPLRRRHMPRPNYSLSPCLRSNPEFGWMPRSSSVCRDSRSRQSRSSRSRSPPEQIASPRFQP